MAEQPRSRAQRKADVLAMLNAHPADVWVATDGPHLVPLTMAWHDNRIVLATERRSPTVRNLTAGGRARLALGHTRDVVMIDAALERDFPVSDADPAAEAYAAQCDWDPRTAGDGYVFLILTPHRIQAWREVDEIAGRTLMRDGTWLI